MQGLTSWSCSSGSPLSQPHLRCRKCNRFLWLVSVMGIWRGRRQHTVVRALQRVPPPPGLGIWGLLSPNPRGSWLRTNVRVGEVGRAEQSWNTPAQVYSDSQSYIYLTGLLLLLHSHVRQKEGWGVQKQVWEQAAWGQGASTVTDTMAGTETASKKNSELAGQEPHAHWLWIAGLVCQSRKR